MWVMAIDLNDQFGHISLSLQVSMLEQSSLQTSCSFRFEYFLSFNDQDDTQPHSHASVDQKLSFHALERV